MEERIRGNICTPDYDKDFRPLARAILKDLKSQIIYEAMEGAEK